MGKYHSGKYEREARIGEEKLFADKDISQENKDAVRRFLAVYDVSEATKGKFFKQIKHFLKNFNNITLLLDEAGNKEERDNVNKFFQQLKTQYSIASVNTIISVTNRLMTWLNDGIKPYAFRDIKGNKKGEKRSLRPEDMTTLQDRDVLLNACSDIKEKAIIAFQLDAGCRASEITNIKVKDITFHQGGYANANIPLSKTGNRNCPIQRSVKYLSDWLEVHPKKDDPEAYLFVETQKKTFKPYSEAGFTKLIRRIYSKAKINKPCDVTTLRHSSNTIDKIDGMSPELSSSRHGQSIEYWEKTYGRLDANDRVQQMRNHVNDHSSMKKTSISCSICNHVNTSEETNCKKCGNPLNLEEALKQVQDKKELQEKVKYLEDQIKFITNTIRGNRKEFGKVGYDDELDKIIS